jgi:hypothetical protein
MLGRGRDGWFRRHRFGSLVLIILPRHVVHDHRNAAIGGILGRLRLAQTRVGIAPDLRTCFGLSPFSCITRRAALARSADRAHSLTHLLAAVE